MACPQGATKTLGTSQLDRGSYFVARRHGDGKLLPIEDAAALGKGPC